MKRVVIVSDFHCGHIAGLTPPDWQKNYEANHPEVRKAAQFQRQLWNFYESTIQALKPIDIFILNGDAIDGKGERSGGVEQGEIDRNEQIEMAAQCIRIAAAPIVRILYGTRYHTGKEEDWEKTLAKLLPESATSVEGHAFLNINGCNFDIKHKISSSSIPHGRTSALMRAWLWNRLWTLVGRQPKADVIIRSHVHYHQYCGGRDWLGLTTPALTYNSAYGIRECEGIVEVGLMYFDVKDDGQYDWGKVWADFSELSVQPTML